MRDDVLSTYPALDPNRVHVVKNGIDTEVWHPAPAQPDESVLAELGVDMTRPIVAFVGRITRQKGVPHLIAAAHRFAPDIQLVLCAGAPDTPEIAAEVTEAVQELARSRTGVFWVREMMAISKIREILSAATVFVCPSVYEPLGIVNLEAMACATAVVASDVGGIPEVVSDGHTGVLVHYDADDPRVRVAAGRCGQCRGGRPRARPAVRPGGRQRCIEEFSWATSPSRPSRSIEGHFLGAILADTRGLAGDAPEFVAERGRLIGGQFDDQTPAALQRYPHHDASPLLCCFQWTVAGPGLHRRHRVLPPHGPARTVGLTEFPLLFPIRGMACAKTRRSSPGRPRPQDALTPRPEPSTKAM